MLTTKQFGDIAENLISILYRLMLYRLIARKWKCKAGEVDLICSRGKTLVFIEVKARSNPNIAEIVSFKQQKRIKKSALYFLSIYPKYFNYDIRFDLAIIQTFKFPKIIYNAWK